MGSGLFTPFINYYKVFKGLKFFRAYAFYIHQLIRRLKHARFPSIIYDILGQLWAYAREFGEGILISGIYIYYLPALYQASGFLGLRA